MSGEKIKLKLKAALHQRGSGLLPLATVFKEFDVDGSGQLNWEEFCGALRKCGLTPSAQEARLLFLECDKDQNNEVSYHEFLETLRVRPCPQTVTFTLLC